MKILDNPSGNDTLTSVSLLDITTENVIKPPKRETDRKKKYSPRLGQDEANDSGVRDYNPTFGSRK